MNIDARDLRGKRDVESLEHYIKIHARAEAETNLGATLGEFVGEDESDTKTWDTKGLSSWAMSRFQVNLSQAQIRKSTPADLEQQLRDAAVEQIDRGDCSGLSKYLEPLFAEKELAAWARDKFGIELTAEEIATTAKQSRVSPAESITELIVARARESYARRDIEYPVNHVLTYAFGGEQGSTDNPYAADFVRGWIRSKYGVEVTVDYIRSKTVRELHDEMCGYQEEMTRGGKLEKDLDLIMKTGNTQAEHIAAFNARFGLSLNENIFKPDSLPPRDAGAYR